MNKTVVVELDQNGKEIFHTAGYEKYWISRVGMETVWLRKERVKEVVSVQETFAAMEFLEKPERGIVSAEISIRMKMIDESCRWTRVGYEIMMPDNGTDKKVVVTFTDEEKEKQSEAEYAEVIRERDNLILTISGGIAIYEITDKIRTVYITEETAALAGYTKKELMEIIGENALALCHPDDIKTTQNYFKTRRQQVRVMSYEYRIKNKNGMYQWVSVRARFVQQKNSILLYTIMTDIDQIKKAEEDARMQKKMLELALQQSDFRFWDYDIKTHRLYRSWAVTQQVGFGEYEENVPEGFVELGLIHPDDCEAYLEFYHNVQQGKNQRLTFRAIHQNGEWGWMDIAYRVFFNEQGEPVRAIGVGGDVSKQREKEQKYLKDLEQSNENLRHEIAKRDKSFDDLKVQMQQMQEQHGNQIRNLQGIHNQELEAKDKEISRLNTILEKAFNWFPLLKEMLRMEKLCYAIGFTKDMVNSLLTKKEAIRCNGKIYSEEHRRRFEIKNDIFKVEKSPIDENKLVLTINRQPIGEWFKEQWEKLRQGLRQSTEEPRKSRGFRM